MDAARVARIPVRAAVSCMTDCPYEGATDPDTVVYVAKALADMGCYEIGLYDTINRIPGGAGLDTVFRYCL